MTLICNTKNKVNFKKTLIKFVLDKPVIIKSFIFNLIFFLSYTFAFTTNIDSLEKAANNAPDKIKPEIYNTLAKAFQNSSYEKADKYTRLALEYSQKTGDKKNESDAYFNLGYNYVTLNNISESKKYFQKSLDIRIELKDQLLISSSLNALGNVTRLMGNNKQALDYYFKALEIRKASGDKLLIAATNNNIGVVYKFWGNFEKALDYYLQSLRIAESLNDTTIITPALINIGNIYSDLKKYKKSLDYYFRVLEISQKTDNPSEVASIYNSIGSSYSYMKDTDNALKYFDYSYDLAKKIGNVTTQSDALNNLGELYHQLNDLDKALKYYQLSADLSAASYDVNSNATSLNNIGTIYLSQKQYKKALPFLLKSLELNTEHENMITLKGNYTNLAKAYKELGDYKKAYHYQYLYTELNDSISNESTNKKLIDLEIQFETEKKQKEIELLKNEKEIQSGIKNYLVALLVLGVLLIIVILTLFLLKIRANRMLAEKNDLISIQKNVLSKTLEDLNKTNKANETYLKLINEELSRASEYVISLIPCPIKEGNIRSHWMLKPSSKLGGDTFGYHWLDNNHFAMYLIDVSGHGVGVSLHSVSILNTIKFQTLAGIDYKNPEQVLSTLNKVFQMREHNKLFFTIWYGVYNNESRELKFATAGHPPAVMIDNSGNASLVGTKNFVIGGTKKFNYTSDSIFINSSSKLYIFSDGVYEIRDKSGNIWSIDELMEFIRIKSSESDNDLIELYNFAMDFHQNDTLDDDFSIIKIEID